MRGKPRGLLKELSSLFSSWYIICKCVVWSCCSYFVTLRSVVNKLKAARTKLKEYQSGVMVKQPKYATLKLKLGYLWTLQDRKSFLLF